MDLTKLFRPNILALDPYSCARDEFRGECAVLLDANENPWANGVNRYPDPRHSALKERIAELRGVAAERLVLGNGSDEIIDLLIRTTCRPGVDNIVVFTPGYSMYEVSAAVNDVEVRRLSLGADFQPDMTALAGAVDGATKLIFVCTPNNPTGNVVPLATVAEICRRHPASLVVVDEAYIDFADAPSAATLLGGTDNLFVLQTLSKAWGMAALRIGIGLGSAGVVSVLGKAKPPYNIGGPAQARALELLTDTSGFAARVAVIKSERERLRGGLSASGVFRDVYPSQANFLLATSDDCRGLYRFLADNGVVVRLRDIPPLIAGGLRITVGTPAENDKLLKLINEWR
jgi:histidinol-phosphate aminotransferase